MTTNDIPGHRITALIGEVMGITVRAARLGGDHQPVLDTRQQAIGRMVEDAHRRGANAIVAMRFAGESIGQAFSDVCAYGTAVIAEPIPGGQPGATPQSATLARDMGVAPPPAPPVA